MEVFISVIFQFVAVFVLQCLFQLPFEWVFFAQKADHLGRKKDMKSVTFLFCVILGLCVGVVSLVVYRQSLINNDIIRFLNIFITPYVVSKIICWMHDRRTYLENRVYLFDHFWNAYIFAFGMTIVRYIFITVIT